MAVPPLLHVVLVFVGGGLGSVLRYLTSLAALALFGPGFPWGTLTVNVVGSGVMGFVAAYIVLRWTPEGGGDALRLFLMTGVLGGFTTFSAFSLDVLTLWQRGAVGTATVYAVVSVAVSILALVLAAAATRSLMVG
ncbi:fluoride efflux transporter CrcB [Prosthecomicrobium sp. N25]|uniref:fluoride efflux transporter CrcB n=1 Tax=Prosthecomicrobium sp. N25 TaxID=3129254 RepID=UPI003077AA3C